MTEDTEPSIELAVRDEDTANLTSVVAGDEESTSALHDTGVPRTHTVDLRPRAVTGNQDARVAPEMVPGIGTLLRDRYVLEECIGTGGHAFVFRARDLRREHAARAEQRVAVKILRDEMRRDSDALARLKQEFSLLQRLAHPHIVRVFDLDVDHSTWFLTMELLEGRTLGNAMRSNTETLSSAAILNVVQRCADALQFAHARGVVHCDLKPGNIFLTHAGDVRLLDFGASCLRTPGAEALAVAQSATLVYASPQVLRHEPCDPRDDIFSLACVTYEALSGQHPFNRKPAIDAQEQGLVAERHPSLTSAQWHALAAALAFDRDARPASIQEFARQMHQVTPSAPPRVVKGDNVEPPHDARNFKRFAAGVALLAVGAAMVPFLAEKSEAPILAGRMPTTRATPPTTSQLAQNPAVLHDAMANVIPPVSNLFAPLRPIAKTLSEPVFVANTVTPAAQVTDVATVPAARALSRSQVVLENEAIVVSSRASAAVIPLLREGQRIDVVTIRWRTVAGSAKPGVDYIAVDAGVARLHDRQTRQMLFVSLHANSVSAAERSFVVELQGVSSSGQLGKRTATRVIIRDRV